jgi:hypothetical protein
LINEIKKRSQNSVTASNNYNLYRLFVKYSTQIKQIKRRSKGIVVTLESFYEFILDIHESNEVSEFSHYVSTIVDFFKTFYILPSKTSMVHGIEMDSTLGYPTGIVLESLEQNWFLAIMYSSWFKFRNCNYNEDVLFDEKDQSFQHKNDTKDKYSYGQFNYFFETKFTFEPNLGSIKIARVMARNVEKCDIDGPFIDKIRANNEIDKSICFVLLDDVYSTRILTCAVTIDNHPVRNPQNVYRVVNKTSYTVTKTVQELTHIMMLPLNSDRDSIKKYYC